MRRLMPRGRRLGDNPAAMQTLARLARALRAPAPQDDRARPRPRARRRRAHGAALRLPRDHGGRHQRQGLDLRDARVDRAAGRLPHRRLHLAAPGALRGALPPARRDRCRPMRWCRISSGWRRARQDVQLTYFEFTTLAILQPAWRPASWTSSILEVGLGGRLDAVNIIDADCAVITSIDLDHMEFLGPDRESIGREKAGILRAGRPADRERPGAAAQRARPPRKRSAPTCGCSAATSTSPATSSSGAGPGAAGATRAWPIRRCAAPTS